jgi:cephalosporin-C deacetylase-like acetyl esterase
MNQLTIRLGWRFFKSLVMSAFIGIFFLFPEKSSAQNYNALSWREATAYNSYLMRSVHQQYADRKTNLEQAFTSKKKMLEYKDACRHRYLSILGTFPEKTDLKARVTASNQQTGFHVENIVFESMPHRYVTANLYVPDGKGPFPVSLELCGHGLNGKVPASSSAMMMAANGIAVMVVDPLGQGERLQLIDEKNQPLTRGVTTEHTLLNPGCNLTGSSLAALEMWDNHRAIDYLLTRRDINPEKIAVYGSSGGGTQTAYLIGYDKRIKVAAICSFFSQRERVLELPGPSDGCQHIPYEGSNQIEIADFALMNAPNPILILSGKYDFVDLWGAQQGFKELQKAYTTLGVPEKAEMLTVETGHGLGAEKTQKLLTFFKHWLNQDDSPVKSFEKPTLTVAQLLCTSCGQVNPELEGAYSLMAQNENQYQSSANQRIAFLSKESTDIRKKILEILGISDTRSPIKIQPTGHYSERDAEAFNYQIVREGEMPVPCVSIIPNVLKDNAPVYVILNENGKEEFLRNYEHVVSPYVGEGAIVVAADLRGLGETADLPANNDPKYWNKEYRYSMISMHIGKPIMGQRVTDLISVLDFISAQPKMQGRPINIIANGLYGPVSIHAAYLDKRIHSVELSRSMKSFTEYVRNPMQHDMYGNVLFGVLNYYDLKDLIQKGALSVTYKD